MFDSNYHISEEDNYFLVHKNGLFYCYVLKNPSKITLDNEQSSEIVYSSLDVDGFIEKKLINENNLQIKYKNKYLNYRGNKNCLFNFIDNNLINLIMKEDDIPKIVLKKPLKFGEQSFPISMSKYFYDYFKYQDKDNKNAYFIYENSDIRRQIATNIHILHYLNDDVHHYKLTGPSSIGKSTTLFYNCCRSTNRIYLNLSVLRKYHEEKKKIKFIDVIINECSRLDLKNEDIDNLNKFIEENINLDSFTFLYNFLVKLSDISSIEQTKIVMVFDQFKKKNFNSLPNFENLIEDILIKNKLMKVIYCCSINDYEIKTEFLKNPDLAETILTMSTQYYFFYYSKLYEIKIDDKNPLNELFGSFQKYLYIFKKLKNKNEIADELKSMENKIYEKIEDFESNNIQTFISKELNKSNYYTFLISNLDIKLDLAKIVETLTVIPLKYIVIEIDEDNKTFTLRPLFPYIKDTLKKGISKYESYEYFKQQKYLEEQQTFRIKSDYFKTACKIAIASNNILKLPEKDFIQIEVDEIISMDHINKSVKERIDEILGLKKEEDNSPKNKYKIEDIEKHIIKNKFNIIRFTDYVSEEIRETFYPIEYFRQWEYKLQVLKKELIKKNYSNFSGEENFIIDQKDNLGECLDYALIYGKKMKKIFFGFQIKCFDPYVTHSLKDITKYKIKNKVKKILINSFSLFNCKIIAWHYCLILYLNKKDFNGMTMNKDVINHCKRKNIYFIYYDPYENLFYDGNNIINELKTNNSTNLDFTNICQCDYVSYDCEIKTSNKLLNYNLAVDDITKMCKELSFIGLGNYKKCEDKLVIIIDYFQKIFNCRFEYCGNFNLVKDKNLFHLLPFPLSNILIIIKLINNGYAGIFHHNKKYEIKILNNNNKISYQELIGTFNVKNTLFYCFRLIDGRLKRNELGMIDDDDDIIEPFIELKEKII